MRESIGGAWLFGIVIVFIFFFAAFLTYSINYTRAFNVKNEVINYIEHMEGFSIYTGNNIKNASEETLKKSTEGRIYYLVNSIGYDYDKTENIPCDDNGKNKYGVCIVKICQDTSQKNSFTHYKVTSYISLELPIIGLKINIPVTGETRTITADVGNMDCSN